MLTFGDCEYGVNYTDRQAAYGVIFCDGLREKVAVVRNKRGKYFLPGGGAFAGESLEQTVLREISEEMGCKGRISCRIGEATQYFFAPSDNKHYKMEAVFFAVELLEEPQTGVLEDGEELCWLPITEAQEKLFHACHAWAVGQVLSIAHKKTINVLLEVECVTG